jgi:hypothetical protein
VDQNWNRGPIYSLGDMTVSVEEVECEGCKKTFENRLSGIPDWTEVMVVETEHGFLCKGCYWERKMAVSEDPFVDCP